MVDLAVIMSIYYKDNLQFVKESVQSILDQTFRAFDYYLIFDGPVKEDVEKYVTSISDKRIRLHRLEKNSGLAVALNYLLEMILKNPGYRYIARMDADDISRPERLEKQRSFLINNPDITVLGSLYEEIDESGKHMSYKKLPEDHESLRRRYYTRTPFAHSSVMFHRRLIENAGFYPTDTILMEDNVLWGRALKAGMKFANISSCLIRLRIDRNFYKRRSGIVYGRNYIKTRLKTFSSYPFSFYRSVMVILIGIMKMLPSPVLRVCYTALD